MEITVVNVGESPMNQFTELGTVQADKLHIIEFVNAQNAVTLKLVNIRESLLVPDVSFYRWSGKFVVYSHRLDWTKENRQEALQSNYVSMGCWERTETNSRFQLDSCTVIGINLWVVANIALCPGWSVSIRFQINSHSFSLPVVVHGFATPRVRCWMLAGLFCMSAVVVYSHYSMWIKALIRK